MRRVFARFSRGSVLVYTLILLGIVLTASIGMMVSSVRDLRSTGTQEDSMQAFQVANSGLELMISEIKNHTSGSIQDVASSIYATGISASCSSDQIVVNDYINGGNIRLSFSDVSGEKLECSDDVSDIVSVKSVGMFRETVRAVEAAVAAGVEVVTVVRYLFREDPSDTPQDSFRILEGPHDVDDVAKKVDNVDPNNSTSGVNGLMANAFVNSDGIGCKVTEGWKMLSCVISTTNTSSSVGIDGDLLAYKGSYTGDSIDGCVTNDWNELTDTSESNIATVLTIKCAKN